MRNPQILICLVPDSIITGKGVVLVPVAVGDLHVEECHVSAKPYQRTDEQADYRNGKRKGKLQTRVDVTTLNHGKMFFSVREVYAHQNIPGIQRQRQERE